MSIVRGLLDKRLRKLKKRVRRIAKATPPERHRIRITAKKLRLMCEFFESLVCEGRPRKRYDRIVSALNNVQKVLGRLQDDVVRRSFLAQLSREWPATSHDHLSIERAIEAITLGRSKTASLLKKARSKSADLAAAKVFL